MRKRPHNTRATTSLHKANSLASPCPQRNRTFYSWGRSLHHDGAEGKLGLLNRSNLKEPGSSHWSSEALHLGMEPRGICPVYTGASTGIVILLVLISTKKKNLNFGSHSLRYIKIQNCVLPRLQSLCGHGQFSAQHAPSAAPNRHSSLSPCLQT